MFSFWRKILLALTQVEKTLIRDTIGVLPPVLILNLKRFETDYSVQPFRTVKVKAREDSPSKRWSSVYLCSFKLCLIFRSTTVWSSLSSWACGPSHPRCLLRACLVGCNWDCHLCWATYLYLRLSSVPGDLYLQCLTFWVILPVPLVLWIGFNFRLSHAQLSSLCQ